MKNWKLGLVTALCLTILSACDSEDTMTGSLITGASAFNFMDKDGKQQSLPAGKSYNAKIQLTDKGAELDISTGTFSGVAMLLPNPTTSLSGTFKVSAAESKQNFDSSGDVEITSAQRDNSHSDSCVLTYNSQYVCTTSSKLKTPAISAQLFGNSPNDPIPGGPGGGSSPGSSPNDPIPGGPGNGNDNNNNSSAPVTTCSWVQEPVYGSQWVDETIELSTKNVSIDFNDSASQTKLASFNGSRDMGSSVTSSSAGACR